MRISSRDENGVKVIELNGQLDTNGVGAFRESFLAEADSTDRVIVDCAGLEYLDSSGLATLLNLYKNLAAREAKLVLCGIPEGILRVVRFTKLDKVLTLAETLDEGFRALSSGD